MKKIKSVVMYSSLIIFSAHGAQQEVPKIAGAVNMASAGFQQDVPGRDLYVVGGVLGGDLLANDRKWDPSEEWSDEFRRWQEDGAAGEQWSIARSADLQAAFASVAQEFRGRRERSESLDAMLNAFDPVIKDWKMLQDPFVNAHNLFFASQYEQAIPDYMRLLHAGGGTPEQMRKGHIGLGESYLALGHLVPGFKERECRLGGEGYKLCKGWDGKTSLDGKKLLIRPEGGFGDIAFFQLRYVPIIQSVYPGCTIVLEGNFPQKSIYSLLSNVQIVAPGAGKDFDYDIYGMSLPCHFSINGNEPTDLRSIPSHAYLSARPERVAYWQQYLQRNYAEKGILPIGIFWAASANAGGVFRVYQRDIDPTLLINSLAGEHVALFNLQGPGSEAVVAQHQETLINFVDFDKEAGPFQDTVAFMHALKNLGGLVIGIDTGALNFAGAVGVETIALLPAQADWRWGVGQRQSVWFPSMTLVRQQKQGDWGSVVSTVQDMIRQKASAYNASAMVVRSTAARVVVPQS